MARRTHAVHHQNMPRKIGSVQHRFMPVRDIHDHMLMMTTPSGEMAYLNVFQVEGISFDLKSEEEQALLIDRYQAVLCALPCPVQILWRILPLKWTDYLHQFFPETDADKTPSQEAPTQELDLDAVARQETEHQHNGLWEELAASYTRFIEHLASQRTLLDRNIYLIVRLTDEHINKAAGVQRIFRSPILPRKKQRTRKRKQAENREKARQQLDVQCEELTRLLGTLNLSVRRLSGPDELAPLYYSCLSQQQADLHPLPHDLLDGIGRPVQGQMALSGKQAVHWNRTQSQDRKGGDTRRNFAHLADLLAPAAITITPDLLKIDHEDGQHPQYARTLSVSQLPRRVQGGFLRALANLDEAIEVSFHLVPQESATMVSRFRVQQARHLSSLLVEHNKGNALDPHIKMAEGDLGELIDRVASGEEHMFDMTMLVLVRGASIQELNERCERVMAVLRNMLLRARVALFEQEKAFRACLPYAHNPLGEGILLSASAIATMFHFMSNSLFMPSGILEGVTPQGDPVVLDPWGTGIPNANRLVLGIPGSGKSYSVKGVMLRTALNYAYRVWKQTQSQQVTMQLPLQMIAIDAEREFIRPTRSLGQQGQIIRLAPGSVHRINPFDLPMVDTEAGSQHGDRLADHIQKLHTLLEIMLADHTPTGAGKLLSGEKGLLDRCLYETYRRVGITSDVRTHNRPAPLMRDLYDVLESAVCGPDPTGLTERLRRYVHGSLAGLFAGPTNVSLNRLAITFDIYDLETELRPIGLFLVSHFVWTTSFQSRIPRLLIIDEAATLYRYEAGAQFMEDMVQRARKHYLGVIIISQHPGIFRQSAIPANCATHVLMRQDATTLEEMHEIFHLSEREQQLLGRLGPGEALLLTSEKRLHVRFVATDLEHMLATTNPRELATWRQDPKYQSLRELLEPLFAPEQPQIWPIDPPEGSTVVVREEGNV